VQDAAITAAAPAPDYEGETEEEWVDRRQPSAPRLPGTVLAAGIIWIVFGSLILLSRVLELILMFALPPQAGDRAAGGAFAVGQTCAVVFIALVGGVFVHVGVTSLTGTAKDTLGNGIGSFFFAALLGGVGLLGALAKGQPILAVISLATGAGLLAAGVLACVGRGDYKAWRHARKAPVRR
jgi:hypothetical protein